MLNCCTMPATSGRSEAADDGGHEQGHRRQEQHPGLQACGAGVVLLDAVLEATQQERHAEHEQRVGDDRASDRGFHEVEHASTQCSDGDDQFREVAERGIQQPTHGIAGLRRDAFGRMAEQGGEGDDCEHGEYEQCRVRLWREVFAEEYGGHGGKQPQQWIRAQALQDLVHDCSSTDSGFASLRRVHAHEDCHDDRDIKLPDRGFDDRERTCCFRDGQDVAIAHGRQRDQAEIEQVALQQLR